MGAPATTGQLRNNIRDMKIGDYIVASFDCGTKAIGNLGTATQPEIPLTGNSWSTSAVGSFYFIKVDAGLLLADRVVAHSVSWDSLNSNKLIQGKVYDSVGVIRSLCGGVAYVDSYGNSSTTDKGLGAFPVSNEWKKYIVDFPQSKISLGKTIDDVFAWSAGMTWTQDTPILAIGSVSNRVLRGKNSLNVWIHASSSTSSTDYGFRPVLEYKVV